ncbi:hypothetical protein Poli38472_000814 [Pythium oligandrum]|uniref:Nucleoporin protein Ndc1-Nup n=1 Tax=Pythium oligandrum TaxID=41045 RepID=A0A8K1CCL7_PYTOL|nr:hypothetical protein Poli38472_000814 [Pythium oligandrum]|eukprot:TMW60772.1 hypothetical protein Poli38472_000814 [Pythium oligandrum]
MGFVHALEVLHAVLKVSDAPTQRRGLSDTLELPFPHLQQRLQQSLRGVVLVGLFAVTLPLALSCVHVLPNPTFVFPGFVLFGLTTAILAALALVQLLLRYVMLPSPSRSFLSDQNSAVYGWVQTTICVVVEIAARLYQEPQLLVLFTLSIFHSWLWKSIVSLIFVASADIVDEVDQQFGTFAFVGGVVSFVSFVWLQERLDVDPFVLDPRSVLETALLRDSIRALRRGGLVWILGRALLFVTQSDSVTIFGFRYHRALFQITSNTIESFALLSTASIFRILLFRANYKALENVTSGGNLWDTLAAPRDGDQWFVDSLFAEHLAISSQSITPLSEQYIIALKTRMDHVVKTIAGKKVQGAPATFEHVACLEKLFKFTNLSVLTKFDVACRRSLYGSEKRWMSFVEVTTAVLDSFTLSMQLLNTVPERKNAGQEEEIAKLEKSLPNLVNFVLGNAHVHPLLLLDAHPHLSNLRISSSAIKSKVRYFVESRAQFAIRRFLIEEARRRVFVQAAVVQACQQVLCHLVSASRTEDVQGNVQHSVPAILSSLVECRGALESYIDMSSKIGNNGDIYVAYASALARGLDKGIYRITDAFYNELGSFGFAPNVKQALESYVSFSK